MSLAYAAAFEVVTNNVPFQGYKTYVEGFIPNKITHNVADVVLVHGLTYSSHQFDINVADYSVARRLANAGFRVWLIDIVGYGNSEKPKDGFIVNSDFAADNIATVVKWIQETQRVKQVNVLGWSWGTVTTSRFAEKHPDWVHRLVLYAPIYRGFGIPLPTQGYQPFSDEAALNDFPKVTGTNNIDFNQVEKSVVDTYLKQSQDIDGAGSPNGGRRDLSQDRSVPLFNPSRLTMPVLIIGGSADPYLNWKQDIPYIYATLPNTNKKLVKLDGAMHGLMIEKNYYHVFAQELYDFFK